MGLLRGKALESAKSLVALLTLVLTALSTVVVDNKYLTIALVVLGAVGVWLTPNQDGTDVALKKLEKAINRDSETPQNVTVITSDAEGSQ